MYIVHLSDNNTLAHIGQMPSKSINKSKYEHRSLIRQLVEDGAKKSTELWGGWLITPRGDSEADELCMEEEETLRGQGCEDKESPQFSLIH